MPLLDLFLATLWFVLFFGWLFFVVVIVLDIFRSHDLSGGAKAVWGMVVLLLPLVGVVIYLVARGGSMQARTNERAPVHGEVHSTASTSDELTKLAALHDRGKLTDTEFEAQKAKLLG